MIVLGPHVFAHNQLEGNLCDKSDDENDFAKNYDASSFNIDSSSAIAYHDAADGSNTSDNGDVDKRADFCNDAQCASPPPSVDAGGELLIHTWKDARMKVSTALGSIGAPPLTADSSSRPMHNNTCSQADDGDDTCNDSSKAELTNKDFNLLMHRILDMTTSHTELLQTLHGMLETLSVGTSVRLGLGHNTRLVGRAERAWVERQLRLYETQHLSSGGEEQQQCNNVSNCIPTNRPRLAMQKLRSILHQSIVNQASSLQSVLERTSNHQSQQSPQQQKEWGEFNLDMQHSLQLPHTILTLSQLTSWVNDLGTYLSFVLSQLLDRKCLHCHQTILSNLTSTMEQSSQMARERMAFLNSACPSLASSSIKPPTKDDGNETRSKYRTRERERAMTKMMDNLQSTLDAARVSLYSFEHSHHSSNCDNPSPVGSEGGDEVSTDDFGDDADADIWWSHFKELMERSSAYAAEFEDQFLSTQKDEEEGAAVDDSIAAECSEHVSDATAILPNNNDNGLAQFANKTVVFSGSGTKKKQPPRRRNATSDSSSTPTSSVNVADQVMLLHDLEIRIKTLGLAEEVIVNEDTSDCNDAKYCGEGLEGKQTEDTPSSNYSCDRQREEEEENRKKNRPFFLGVSGPMLSELSSTMNLPWNDGISKEECWDMS